MYEHNMKILMKLLAYQTVHIFSGDHYQFFAHIILWLHNNMSSWSITIYNILNGYHISEDSSPVACKLLP